MTPEEFVDRLEAISIYGGEPFGRLRQLHEKQAAFSRAASQLKGFAALSSGWRCFFLETVQCVNSQIRPQVTNPMSASYPIFLERLVLYFNGLSAAEYGASSGYRQAWMKQELRTRIYEIRLIAPGQGALVFATAKLSDDEAADHARLLLHSHPDRTTAEIWRGLELVRQV